MSERICEACGSSLEGRRQDAIGCTAQCTAKIRRKRVMAEPPDEIRYCRNLKCLKKIEIRYRLNQKDKRYCNSKCARIADPKRVCVGNKNIEWEVLGKVKRKSPKLEGLVSDYEKKFL